MQSRELSTLPGFYARGDGTNQGRIEAFMSPNRPRLKRSAKPTHETAEIITDSVDSAKAAGLRYVTDARPGIQRHKRGSRFRYVGPDGGPIRDHETLARIKLLVIPPAWQGVWTWAGTVLTAMMLRKLEPCETPTQAKKNVVEAMKAVAERLGNTPTICRKCYVHPAVLEHYFSGAMLEAVEAEEVDPTLVKLRDEEQALLYLLAHRNGRSA